MIQGLAALLPGLTDAPAPATGPRTATGPRADASVSESVETSRLGQLFALLLGGAAESPSEAEASDAPTIDAPPDRASGPAIATSPTDAEAGHLATPAATHDGLRSEDLEGLDPEFAGRLERVIARMEAEFGTAVEVVETLRSPERQTKLFAQGRTRPGPVVTWTMDSMHLQGRAADVRLNGSWHDPEAYRLLERVARDEGLRTLGPRDPGHIELPAAEVERVVARAPRRTIERVARPANVAPTAVPTAARAAVASVARTASPAVVGMAVRRTATVRTASPRPTATGSPTTRPQRTVDPPPPTRFRGVVAETIAKATTLESGAPPTVTANANAEAHAPLDRVGLSARVTRTERHATRPRVEARSASDAVFTGTRLELVRTPPAVTQTSRPLSAPGADGLERVTRVMDLQAQAPSASRLDIPDIDGQGTRLRMSLVGSELDAVLEVGDAVALRRMRTRVDQLHRSLEGRGLEIRALDVRPTEGARATTPGTVSAITASAVTEGPAAHDTHANRDESSRSRGEPQPRSRDRGSSQQQQPQEDR